MGNSTMKLQDVVDYASTLGDLTPHTQAGGFTQVLACGIADDVMREMLAARFNWKFNRINCAPFLTISRQQDYPQQGVAGVGWLEHACIVDINNTQLPKPIAWLECVRDLERTSWHTGQPGKICWLPNDQLVEATWNTWPGAGQLYTDPRGAVQTPTNPPTAILDANGNILLLTTYGITGNTAPAAAVSAAAGVTVADGTAVWTVANLKGQGFRVSPLPPQSGVVWEVHVTAQAKPPQFANLQQTIDPIPDDYAHHFRNGFIALCHRHAAAPLVRARFENQKKMWLDSLSDARGQGDREKDDACIVPDRNIMQGSGSVPLGPAWPYGPLGPG